jgi:hypothetical protein
LGLRLGRRRHGEPERCGKGREQGDLLHGVLLVSPEKELQFLINF